MLEPFPKDWIYDQISCEIFNFHINFPHRISPHTSSLYQYLHKVIGPKTISKYFPHDPKILVSTAVKGSSYFCIY